MASPRFNNALIVGAGSGLSAALARALARRGMKVALAARSTEDLAPLAKETGARTFRLRCERARAGGKLFAELDAQFGAPEIAIYNASFRTRGALIELDPAEVQKALAGERLWRLPGRAAGGAAHAAESSTASSCSPARPRA